MVQIRLAGPSAPSWVLAESAASVLCRLLIGLAIGPDADGTRAIAIAAFLLVDVLAAAPFPGTLCQRPHRSPQHVRSAPTASFLLGLATALPVAAPLLSAGVGDAELPPPALRPESTPRPASGPGKA